MKIQHRSPLCRQHVCFMSKNIYTPHLESYNMGNHHSPVISYVDYLYVTRVKKSFPKVMF